MNTSPQGRQSHRTEVTPAPSLTACAAAPLLAVILIAATPIPGRAATVSAAAPATVGTASAPATAGGTHFTTALVQFFDPSSSNLSEPLTFLWSQQLYHSISDVNGARIVRIDRDSAGPSGSTPLISTAVGSHDIAAAVAAATNAQAAIWGVLADLNQNEVTLAASLTTRPEADAETPGAGASAPLAAPVDWRALPATAYTRSAEITPLEIAVGRLNFAPLTISLKRLYGDNAVVRCDRDQGCAVGSIRLYAEANANSHGVSLEEGEPMTLDLDDPARRPSGKFTPVIRQRDNHRGWVYSFNLDFLPAEVFISSRTVIQGRRAVTRAQASDPTISGPKFLRVLDSRVIGPSHTAVRWYHVALAHDESAWIDRTGVHAVWPASQLNFIAGLYRYALGECRPAYDEFDAFAQRANRIEENVAVSLAYQFMAACALRDRFATVAEQRDHAVALLNQAAALTPFDDNVPLLSAYARFGWRPEKLLAESDMDSITQDVAHAEDLMGNVPESAKQQAQLRRFVFAASTPYADGSFVNALLDDVPNCRSQFGTLSVQPASYESGLHAREGVSLHFIKVLARQSNCFTVALDTQTTAKADYVMQPRVRFMTDTVMMPDSGYLAPHVGTHTRADDQTAKVTLSLEDGRSAERVASVEGESKTTTYLTSSHSGTGWVAQKGQGSTPAPGSGQLVTKAYLDAFSKLVESLQSSQAVLPENKD